MHIAKPAVINFVKYNYGICVYKHAVCSSDLSDFHRRHPVTRINLGMNSNL